jgi:uncharacterized membrane protein
MKILFIILSILVYILNVIISYRFIRIAHSKNGRWYHLDTDWTCIFLSFCPIVNFVFMLVVFFTSPYKGGVNFNNFFKVKN